MTRFFEALSGAVHSAPRLGRLSIGDVVVDTPVFMPVGTRGAIKGAWIEDLREIGYRLILGNTYHLYLRPGHERIAALGGLHRFMGWSDGAILTDSGGFQVYSLNERVRFHVEGVEFRSHIDGSAHLFTPESVLGIQLAFGSNIMMSLDDCPPADAGPQRLAEALDRTHRWAAQTLTHAATMREAGRLQPERHRLFGIAQGGLDLALRQQSLDTIQSGAWDGIAVGGLSVGEGREEMHAMLSSLGPLLDPARPRYLMGVGALPDLVAAIDAGFDMFDCVLPTRNARNGQLFSFQGRLNIRNQRFADDPAPLDAQCSCRVCRRYSRAYLRHLFVAGEMLGPMMATAHNLHFYFQFMAAARAAIATGQWAAFRSQWQKIPEAP